MVLSNLSRNFFLVSLFLLVAILIFAAVYAFGAHISEDLKENAFKIMNDTSSQNAAVLQSRLQGQYIMLDALAASLTAEIGNGANNNEIIKTIDNFTKSGDFSSIYITDLSGNAFGNDGDSSYVGDQEFYKKALSGERVLVKTDGEQAGFIQAIPIENEGRIIAVLYGCFTKKDINSLLDTNVYDGKMQLAIFDTTGKLIISSNDQIKLTDISAGDMIFDDGISKEDIVADLGLQSSNDFTVFYNHRYYYITYSPLGINNWSVFAIVPATAVKSTNGFISYNTLILVFQLLIITALLVLAIILYDRSRERLLVAEKERLRQSEESYELVSCLSDSVLFVGDYATDRVRFNHSCRDIFGFDCFCEKISDYIKPNPHVYSEDMDLFIAMGQKFVAGVSDAEAEFRILDADGNVYWQRTEFLTVYDSEGNPQRLIGKITNIDNEKRELTLLQQQAENDSLTNIYNRAAMKIKVDEFLAHDGKKGVHALLMMDIDNFKILNDTFGHYEGDRILTLIANELRTFFRSSDIISRMGGDEFSVLLKNVYDESLINSKAEDLLNRITAIEISDQNMKVTCSIGISIYSSDGRNFEQLYKKADEALYEAKARGKNTYEIYSSLFPTFDAAIGGSE